MDGVPAAVRINQLPFQRWHRTAELTQRWGLPASEVKKVLRVGLRRGTITVRRRETADAKGDEPMFMRIRRHPLPGASRRHPPARLTPCHGLPPTATSRSLR